MWGCLLKVQSQKICVLGTECQGLGCSVSTMLQHFLFKAQSAGASVHCLLQVSCGSTICGSGCIASSNGFHPGQQSPGPTVTLTTHTHCHFWARSANRIRESIHNKNNPSWLQSTVWGWRLCQACRKQWIALSQSPVGILANLPSITLADRSTGQLCRAAVPWWLLLPLQSLSPGDLCHLLCTMQRQGILQRALGRRSQPWVAVRWCSNVAQVTFILDFLGF